MNLSDGMFGTFPAYLCRGLPTGEQVILSWLWYHKMASAGDRMPSLNTLAAEAGCTKKTVIAHLQSLAKRGFVRIFTRQKEGEGTTTNHYEVVLDPGNIKLPACGEMVTHGSNGKWDPRPYLMAWKARCGGYFNVQQCSMVLKRAERDHGKDAVLLAMQKYLKSQQDVRFLSVHRFCETIGGYIEKATTRDYDEAVASGGKRW